jgi:hypothetical protein
MKTILSFDAILNKIGCFFFYTNTMKKNTFYLLLITATFFSYLASPCYAQSSSVMSPNENVQPLQKKTNQHEETDISLLEAKINYLLRDIRKLLLIDTNKYTFDQQLSNTIYAKAEQACPSIALKNLINSNDTFVAPANANKQELQLACEVLSVAVNELKAQ